MVQKMNNYQDKQHKSLPASQHFDIQIKYIAWTSYHFDHFYFSVLPKFQLIDVCRVKTAKTVQEIRDNHLYRRQSLSMVHKLFDLLLV
jgi:hypothetical protein